MRRIGKVTAGVLAVPLCFVAVAGSLYRGQAQGGQSSSQRENAPAQVGDQGAATPAGGGGMRSEEKTVRDAYARLMRYHTAARDEASGGPSVVHKADDYMTIGVNNLRTGFMDEIFGRPLSELVTPRGGEVINLKPNYLRGADGLAHASYGALWEALPEVEKSGKTSGPTVMQAVGEKYKGAVKYTSYEVTVSLEGKLRSYRAMALHFNPGRAEGKPETEILDNITSEMNTVLAERAPRVRSPWAKYVRSNLHEAIVNSIRAKEQAGLPLIPADAPIGYLPGDEIEAAISAMASAADSCNPDPPDVIISDVKAVIKGGFADFEITLNPSPSNEFVILDLTTINGTGQALFDVNNSSSLTISESTTVRVRGFTESSAINNIRLTASFEDFTLAFQDFTVIKVELKELAFAGSSVFTGSSSVGLRKDDNTGDFTAPHWQDNSSPLDGDADDSGDRKYPVAYVKSDTATASVTLSIHPSVSLDGVTISVRGDGPGNLDFPAKSVTTSAGSSGDRLVIDDLRTPSNISSAVECFDCDPATPEGIKWEASITQPTGGSTWKEVGTSRNRIYVLLDKPVSFSASRPFLETIAYLACKDAKGKSTPDEVFEGIWNTFSSRNPAGILTIKTADGGKTLKYYNPKNTNNFKPVDLIRDGNGQCGSFARLMMDAAAAHKIVDTNFPVVKPIGSGIGFMVKKWTFTTGSGKSGDAVYPYLNVILDQAGMLSESTQIGAIHSSSYHDVTDDTEEIPGQSNKDPASLFGNHQFVERTTSGMITWYDPSYGVKYEGLDVAQRRVSVENALDGLFQLRQVTISEASLGVDLNGDGDMIDVFPDQFVLWMRKKPASPFMTHIYQSY